MRSRDRDRDREGRRQAQDLQRPVPVVESRRHPRQQHLIDRQTQLTRIKPAEQYDAMSGCDLVIETATEKEDVKRKIYNDLCPSLKADAILASNTSSTARPSSPASSRPSNTTRCPDAIS